MALAPLYLRNTLSLHLLMPPDAGVIRPALAFARTGAARWCGGRCAQSRWSQYSERAACWGRPHGLVVAGKPTDRLVYIHAQDARVALGKQLFKLVLGNDKVHQPHVRINL